VLRHAEFGAFVQLAPGVEALAPASELPPLPEGWQTALPTGTNREWYILDVDPKQRRIAVTLPDASGVPPESVVPEALIRGKIQRVERFGVFVWLAPGRVGLMPRVWTGAGGQDDLTPRFPVGGTIEVRVVELGSDRRIRLALPGTDTNEPGAPMRQAGRQPGRSTSPRPPGVERGAVRRHAAAPRPAVEPSRPPAEATFGTSLADKLKAALHRRG
jgi:ribosomal protein S1